jgi:hypothetical protein
MVKVKTDLTGMRFGRLVVIKQNEIDHVRSNGQKEAMWDCACDCGGFITVTRQGLKSGDTKSCGCLRKETMLINLNKKKQKFNTYDLESQEYGIGYTEQGEEFWFDKENYDLIKDYYWNYYESGYLVSSSKNNNQTIFFHRLVMGLYEENVNREVIVDHIIHGKVGEIKHDNRKCNLRIVNSSQNKMNAHTPKSNTSGVTGVGWDSYCNKWRAYIKINGRQKTLGHSDSKDECIKMRQDAEKELFGEYRFRTDYEQTGS